ncbi:response regulator [Halosimplex rubrum]|uniref:Response regulator n=1 Tax=Halosimplex rubrum TaxID=869889 RepID=A0A7D5P7P2_9EURY|nr:response regulator [Halosimplex rubrum]QLH76500.1 response regulator [Halosimplex rubrum]
MTAVIEDIAAATANAPASGDESIDVLCVDDDRDYLALVAAHLSEHDDLSVRTETAPADALDHLDAVDCVVSDYDMPGTDGLEFLSDVRERAPTLPFVLFTGSERADIAEGFPESTWTEFLRKNSPATTMSVLAGRIRRLVHHHRTMRTAERTLTAIEATGDGVAVVTPDGDFSFVNRVFASRFGAAPDDLLGRPWRECFPDDEVERLESTALETVRDDWQWTGGTVCETDGGDTFTAQTRVAGLDDGSLVFCLTGAGEE